MLKIINQRIQEVVPDLLHRHRQMQYEPRIHQLSSPLSLSAQGTLRHRQKTSEPPPFVHKGRNGRKKPCEFESEGSRWGWACGRVTLLSTIQYSWRNKLWTGLSRFTAIDFADLVKRKISVRLNSWTTKLRAPGRRVAQILSVSRRMPRRASWYVPINNIGTTRWTNQAFPRKSPRLSLYVGMERHFALEC